MKTAASNYNLATTTSLFLCTTCIAIITIFSLHLYLNHIDINHILFQQCKHSSTHKEIESCDLFKGRWIADAAGPLYTNYSCTTIPISRNCLLQGRKDRDFLHWRWKPEKCELPRFSAQTFLRILRGKKMAFIGDSLARNQMESLLCLLSTGESPKLKEKDEDDKFTTWEFPQHNFTLTALWSPFLVTATAEIVVNGTTTGGFHLHVDRPDPKWLDELPSMDYAVLSSGQWQYRRNYLHDGAKVLGCVNCNAPNITSFGQSVAFRKVFRAVFKAINDCNKCKKNMVTFLRTVSPTHFENGEWHTGGRCDRTRPVGLDEVDGTRPDWEYRDIQVEAARDAEKQRGNVFEVIDVTEMMLARVDGHPGIYWRNQWMNGFSDCAHWCLPGPVDTWNELLLEVIKRKYDSAT